MNTTHILLIIFALLLLYFYSNPMHMFRAYHFVREMFVKPDSFIVKTPATPIPNKRVALCISGQFRDIQSSFRNHITTLLPLNADIFIVGNICITPDDKQKVLEFYKPVRHSWTDTFNPISIQANTDRMFSKIYYCDQLRQEYEKEKGFTYDYVIRIRPDLVLLQAFPSKIFSSITSNNMIYFPSFNLAEIPKYKNIPLDKVYLTDQLFVGTSAAMKTVCECYLHLSEYTVKHCINEYMLLEHIIKSNIGAGVFYLHTSLSRTSIIKAGVKDTLRACAKMLTIDNFKNSYVCSLSLGKHVIPSISFI